MIAATRLATFGRTVMPFATWAAYVIQLGYVGYNLYQYYQDYLAQMERDRRFNTERDLDEVIELVVARRRRRPNRQQQDQQTQEQQQQERQQTTTIEEQTGENVTIAETAEGEQANSFTAAPVGNSSSDNQRADNSNNANVDLVVEIDQENSAEFAEQIDRDRRQQQQRQHHTAIDSQGNQTIIISDDDSDEEGSLNTSLSLESTDTNRGIVKDMYSECFICARTLNDPSKQVATLPFCMHPFHKTCLDGVLKWHSKCPVCDFDIFSPI